MSLLFTDGSSDRVDHGNTGSSPAASTFYAWVYPTALTATRQFFRKGGLTGYYSIAFGGTANVRVLIDYASADATRRSSVSSWFTANAWQFAAVTFDGTNAPKIYRGDLTTTVIEATSYDQTTAPSGARITDGGAAAIVGNGDNSGFNAGFPGRIAVANWIDGTALSLPELQIHQFQPQKHTNSKIFTQYGFNGTSTQPDWSGNGNAGTVTGATQTQHVPLDSIFGWASGWLGNGSASITNLTQSVSDTNTLSDAQQLLLTLLQSYADTNTLSDTAIQVLTGELGFSDTNTLSDLTGMFHDGSLSLGELLDISDALGVFAPGNNGMVDSYSLQDLAAIQVRNVGIGKIPLHHLIRGLRGSLR